MRALLVACLLLAAIPARAEQPSASAPATARTSFWRALLVPEQARAERLVTQGRAQLYPALGLTTLLGAAGAAHRRVAIENALARFERAVEVAPTHLEALLWRAKALALWERPNEDGSLTLRSEEALAALAEVRAHDPLYEAQEVAFQLAIVHTRTGAFQRAAAEYERALAMHGGPDDQALLLANLAEVTMLHGDVTRSLALYERALHVGRDDARVLALWGSAIALDRLGDPEEALARAGRALREDRAPFAALRQSGVFFVPPYERHYYEALGALALADAERAGEETLPQVLARAGAWGRRAEPSVLAQLSDVAPELRAAGEHELATRWFGRAKPTSGAPAGAAGPPDAAPDAAETRRALAAEPEARALYFGLRAVAAFARYRGLAAHDAHGFAEDARLHIAELKRLLRER